MTSTSEAGALSGIFERPFVSLPVLIFCLLFSSPLFAENYVLTDGPGQGNTLTATGNIVNDPGSGDVGNLVTSHTGGSTLHYHGFLNTMNDLNPDPNQTGWGNVALVTSPTASASVLPTPSSSSEILGLVLNPIGGAGAGAPAAPAGGGIEILSETEMTLMTEMASETFSATCLSEAPVPEPAPVPTDPVEIYEERRRTAVAFREEAEKSRKKAEEEKKEADEARERAKKAKEEGDNTNALIEEGRAEGHEEKSEKWEEVADHMDEEAEYYEKRAEEANPESGQGSQSGGQSGGGAPGGGPGEPPTDFNPPQ